MQENRTLPPSAYIIKAVQLALAGSKHQENVTEAVGKGAETHCAQRQSLLHLVPLHSLATGW